MSQYRIGQSVLYARERRGWSQKQLAEAMGVTKGYISMLESHERDPSWSFVCRLSEVCALPLPQLILVSAGKRERDASFLSGLFDALQPLEKRRSERRGT